MPKRVENRVRERREARGSSQVALAKAAQLSRQSVGAIEAGRAIPAVDVALRLARALECTAEDLFGRSDPETVIVAEPAGSAVASRLAIAHVGGRWVSHALGGSAMHVSADGLARRRTAGRVEAEAVRSPRDMRENVLVLGCAPALGLLVDRVNSVAGPGRFVWLSASSTAALKSLAKRQAHVAGVHLVDSRSGEANLPDVRRHAGADPLVVLALACWEVGLLVETGNPKRLRGVADLSRRGLRIVTREAGSGARRLFERELRAAGISQRLARETRLQASGHLEVAHAVSIGAADVGVATRDAAIAFGLDFIGLAEERYDLVVPSVALEDARIRRFFDVMTTGSMRSELASLGYDVGSCGDRVAEVPAA